jgi:hypothetical protein
MLASQEQAALQPVLQRKLLCRGSIGAIMLKIGAASPAKGSLGALDFQHKGDS